MIQISMFKSRDNIYRGFVMDGHAGFADHGEDIVCAAVSVLAINTINSIENFTSDHFVLDTKDDGGFIEFQLKKTISSDSQLLLKSMVLGLQEIERNYGNEYIKLILKEV